MKMNKMDWNGWMSECGWDVVSFLCKNWNLWGSKLKVELNEEEEEGERKVY